MLLMLVPVIVLVMMLVMMPVLTPVLMLVLGLLQFVGSFGNDGPGSGSGWSTAAVRAAGKHLALQNMVMLVPARLTRFPAAGTGTGSTMTVAASSLRAWRHLSLVHIDCVTESARGRALEARRIRLAFVCD